MYRYTLRTDTGAEITATDTNEIRAWILENVEPTGYLALNMVTDDVIDDATWDALAATLSGVTIEREALPVIDLNADA